MDTLTRRALALALGLAGLAGFVDALAYLVLGGFFVSFMSGNTTRGAVQLTTSGAPIALALVVAFVGGVMIGMLVGRASARWRATAILAVVCGFLAVAAVVGTVSATATLLMAVPLAIGMGAVNTVFSRDSKGGIGLTYLTGALVKMGQGIIEGFSGGGRSVWLRPLLMWIAIAAGAAIGGIVFGWLGVAWTLWISVALAAVAAVVGSRAVDR
jgi:uncharacterized membrane protein YoaK (UPF0700 family)